MTGFRWAAGGAVPRAAGRRRRAFNCVWHPGGPIVQSCPLLPCLRSAARSSTASAAGRPPRPRAVRRDTC